MVGRERGRTIQEVGHRVARFVEQNPNASVGDFKRQETERKRQTDRRLEEQRRETERTSNRIAKRTGSGETRNRGPELRETPCSPDDIAAREEPGETPHPPLLPEAWEGLRETPYSPDEQ